MEKVIECPDGPLISLPREDVYEWNIRSLTKNSQSATIPLGDGLWVTLVKSALTQNLLAFTQWRVVNVYLRNYANSSTILLRIDRKQNEKSIHYVEAMIFQGRLFLKEYKKMPDTRRVKLIRSFYAYDLSGKKGAVVN